MKLKTKKLLFSLLGVATASTLATVVAAACANKGGEGTPAPNDPGTSNPGTQTPPPNTQSTFSFRQNLTEEEKTKLTADINAWKEAWPKVAASLNSVSANAGNVKNTQVKFATTRDSGSLTQLDIAYAFGIAPDLISYKWNDAGKQVATSKYLQEYYDSLKSELWTGNGLTAQDLVTRTVGVLLTHDSSTGKYAKFVENSDIVGFVSQSRSAGLPSKTPARFLPNWLFDFDPNKPASDSNKGLGADLTSHAGNPNYITNPYDGLIFTGQMLDKIYTTEGFNNVKNAIVDGKTNFATFEDYARAYATKARNDFSTWAKSVNEWKDKTVLVESPNPQAGGIIINSDFNNADNLAKIEEVFYVQPVYFASVYGDQNSDVTPGLGAKFPIPRKKITDIQKYIDDFGWIGGKTLVSTPESSVRSKVSSDLAEAFENTTDYVIYSVNPFTIQGYNGTAETENVYDDFVAKLTQYINNLSDSEWKQFKPTRVLKSKPVVGVNFFIDRKDMFHDASYGFMGLKVVANRLNKWIKGANAPEVEIGIPKFTKEQMQQIRTFKTNLPTKS